MADDEKLPQDPPGDQPPQEEKPTEANARLTIDVKAKNIEEATLLVQQLEDFIKSTQSPSFASRANVVIGSTVAQPKDPWGKDK